MAGPRPLPHTPLATNTARTLGTAASLLHVPRYPDTALPQGVQGWVDITTAPQPVSVLRERDTKKEPQRGGPTEPGGQTHRIRGTMPGKPVQCPFPASPCPSSLRWMVAAASCWLAAPNCQLPGWTLSKPQPAPASQCSKDSEPPKWLPTSERPRSRLRLMASSSPDPMLCSQSTRSALCDKTHQNETGLHLQV